MIILLVILISGVSIVSLLMLLNQLPSRKQKADAILVELSSLLANTHSPKFLMSFEFCSRLEGEYANRKIFAQVDLGRQGQPGKIQFIMQGLSEFPRQALIISEYPRIVGQVVQKGRELMLETSLSRYDREFYLEALKDLTDSAEKLENEYKLEEN